MKNRIFLAAALFTAAVAGAQTQPTQPAQPTQPTQPTETTKPATPDPNQPAETPVTAPVATTEIAVNTAYVSNPDGLKGLKSEELKPEHFFPVLGAYKASGSSTGDVTVSLDETNKGIVWVDGLSQGKFKAVMKKAPSTYKIPAQKTESGKSVPEGTLFLNPTTKELTIMLGRPFDDADPTSFLTIPSKTKSKGWQYTGVKTDVAVAVQPASEQ